MPRAPRTPRACASRPARCDGGCGLAGPCFNPRASTGETPIAPANPAGTRPRRGCEDLPAGTSSPRCPSRSAPERARSPDLIVARPPAPSPQRQAQCEPCTLLGCAYAALPSPRCTDALPASAGPDHDAVARPRRRQGRGDSRVGAVPSRPSRSAVASGPPGRQPSETALRLARRDTP
jgi:hypothetical protein